MTRPQVLVRLLLSLAFVAGMAACSAGGPVATPSRTCGWTSTLVDKLSKPASTSSAAVVLAALIRVDGLSCDNLVYEGSPKWVGSSRYVFDRFGGIGGPDEPRDLCPVIYDAPSMKLLDELHPDAVKPALPSPDTWGGNSGPKKGWVSWEVETRPDCDMEFSWELAPEGTQIKPGQLLDMGNWDVSGPDASTFTSKPSPDVMDKWFAYQDKLLPNWSSLVEFSYDSLAGHFSPSVGYLSPEFSASEASTYRLDWAIPGDQTDCSLMVFEVGDAFVPKPSPTPGSIYDVPQFPGPILMNAPHLKGGTHGRVRAWVTVGGRLFVDPASTCESARLTLLGYQD